MGPYLALLTAWSLATPPAGCLAYLATGAGESGRLIVRDVSADGESSERASVAVAGTIGELALASTGDRLAYTVGPGAAGSVDHPDAGFQVGLLDLLSGKTSTVTKGEGGWLGLSWSPDGLSLGAIFGADRARDGSPPESWLHRISRTGTVSRLRRIEGEVPRRTAVLTDGRIVYRSEKGRWVATSDGDPSETLLTDPQIGASDWRLSADGKTALDADTFVLRAVGGSSGIVWELPSGHRFDLGRGGSNLAVSANGERYLAWARDLTGRKTIVGSGPFAKRTVITIMLEGRWEPIGVSNDGDWMVAKPGTSIESSAAVAVHLATGKVVPYLRGTDLVARATWMESPR
ncbi:MAG: hypothetical protein KIS66_09445 [Fimbriimonadaceae bacterium]|nr:hypothetical protein [Fimbriimonadaceae bacterium]